MLAFRVGLLISSVILMISGLWAGLLRLGWQLPTNVSAMQHGPLMVVAFFSTLIALERAVGVGKFWVYLAPLLLGLAGFLSLFLGTTALGLSIYILGSAIYLASAIYLFVLQKADFSFVMALGALSLFLANIFWAFALPLTTVVIFWASYLVLIITGERLELSRFVRKPKLAVQVFLASVVVNILGLVVSLFSQGLGVRLVALAFLVMAAWLLRYDIARINLKRSGVYRFMALALLAAYFWLAVAGLWFLVVGMAQAGPNYDAPLHAIFVGFVFSMVFAHAPVIFPAVLKLKIEFSKILYAPLVL
ncbi:MAG TPA: hypothetical protein ENK21_07585, partial [Trueperaceae bacterium]|nr:hypothetical protein [Trueperaceae bacterium]